jgi:hypothetical protein
MPVVRSPSYLPALLLMAAVSAAVALGRTLDLHNADSLIPTLVSLDYWLPFYWGQDRFGMLLPLLAMPVHDSFWNLVFQNALGVFVLLLGAYAAAWRCGAGLPSVAALALLSLLLAWPAETTALQSLTTNQSFAPALGLYALAFALLRPDASRWTRTGAALLMLLGAWTNAGTALLLLAVGAVSVAMPRLRGEASWLLAGVVLSLAGHVLLQKTAPGVRLDTSHVTLVTLAEVASRAGAFWADAYHRLLGPAVWLTVPAVAWALYLERGSDAARQALIAVVIGCGVFGFVMIAFFGGTGRHLTPALPLLLGAILIVWARHLPPVAGPRVVAALTAVVLVQSGVDRPEAGRRRLIARLAEGHAVELFQEGVTIVTGDYWRAWSYAFALNLLHEGMSGTRPVLPVALRAEDFYLQLAHQQTRPGATLAAVAPLPYLYWSVRGPASDLSVVRANDHYEIAVVKSMGE